MSSRSVGVRRGVRVDQGAAYHRGHLLDGRHALFAATVRLSLRSRAGFEAVRDVQGDGTPAAESDHESRDDRDLACGALFGLERSLVFGGLVTRKAVVSVVVVGRPRIFCPMCEEFRG